jgi:large subunit ribosomal protein L32e
MKDLKARSRIKRRRPSFKRQEYFKHASLKDTWRRPKGKHSKMKQREKPRGRSPSPSYSAPRKVRGRSLK